MDRASQPARTGLTDRLAPDIARINFYRFCQLLEQSQQNAPLGAFVPIPEWAFRSAS